MIITNGLNEFYVNGKVTIMTVNYKGEKQLFYIDTDDLERVKRFKWVYTPIGEYAMIEEYFELYRTNNEYEVIMLETEGFHFVDYSDGVYTYILSKQLKEFVDNDTTFTYNDIEDTQERVM